MVCEGSALEGDFGCKENARIRVVGSLGFEEGCSSIDEKGVPSILEQSNGVC
jgi:hypothetical protein